MALQKVKMGINTPSLAIVRLTNGTLLTKFSRNNLHQSKVKIKVYEALKTMNGNIQQQR
jgi:hypothetical protein